MASNGTAQGFSEEQKQYLSAFMWGSDLARSARGLPTFAGTLGPANETDSSTSGSFDYDAFGPEAMHRRAQDQVEAGGGKLCKEEKAKRDKDPFGMWGEMRANAQQGVFPKGTDVFLYKYYGLFHVAPAQDSFMCRLRFPGGLLNAHQANEVARLARDYGGNYVHVTTRANLQIREIGPKHTLDVLTGLQNAGIINKGSGADNIRNVTGSATAGIDAEELIDTRPLSNEMHHYILNHRELYGLPRKFNIAFDGGGSISTLEETNDIAFAAVRVPEGKSIPAGIYFRMGLGGITGHKDFARDTGILLEPDQCVPAAVAVLKTFIEHGDRTDRNKARLKYVLDRWGFEKFLSESEKHLPFAWPKFPLEQCEPRRQPVRMAHLGVHRQKQEGKVYLGVVLPVGKLETDQLEGLATIANRYGSGMLRLTVWQNLLIPDINESDVPDVQEALEDLGLDCSPTSIRAGLVACTGNTGCKFAASNTKGQAMILAEHLETSLNVDQPLNIHLTGCHHSCAQHYIGDIGMLATKVESSDGEELIEGYRVFVGGGYGADEGIGRELFPELPFDEIPGRLESLLKVYMQRRDSDDESFRDFSRRHSIDDLLAMTEQQTHA
ncbi:Sulfite reductase [ferredoxin] [Planctomycetes bacterium Pan216]|uniref:Sulfite reductase [ferredoxin] n=1 Tax=Kolteria novifilia TaxID=2527975 RepID=A0A518B0M0_9BACT|nr:Sulfite reductase [ferredoxin] [Planctomycetes bacterium Pan216]